MRCTEHTLIGQQASMIGSTLVYLGIHDHHMIVQDPEVDKDECLRKLIKGGKYFGLIAMHMSFLIAHVGQGLNISDTSLMYGHV